MVGDRHDAAQVNVAKAIAHWLARSPCGKKHEQVRKGCNTHHWFAAFLKFPAASETGGI